MRLVDALQAMPPKSLEALARRRGVTIDPQKRLAPAEQLARALAAPRDLANVEHWPDDVRSVVRLLAGAPDGLPRESLGGGVLPLVDAALAFSVPGSTSRVALPAEYRAQLPASASDDPRSVRVLAAQLDDETLRTVVGHYLGRTPASPRPLLLGEILARLESEEAVQDELAMANPRERALLAAIEARGGDATTAELLDLSREPVRYASGGRSALPRRSPAHGILRRGWILPVAPDLYAVPSEVAAIIGRDRRAAFAAVRATVAGRIGSSDLLPSRARLSRDSGPGAIALLCGLRAQAATPTADAGASRTAMRRTARDAGVDLGHAEILVAVARGAGLATAMTPIAETGGALFAAWRRGGAWDEARVEEDRYRAGDKLARVPTPTAALRDACLDVLDAIPAGRFALLSDIVTAVLADLRASGAAHALVRAAERAPQAFETSVESVVRHVLVGSLPALGALDRGASEEGEVCRLSLRARRWLSIADDSRVAPPAGPLATWVGQGRLRVSTGASAAALLALADAANVVLGDGDLYVEVTAETLERAVSRGVLLDTVRERLVALAGELDAGAERAIGSVARARVPCELVRASGFLVLSDERLRDALLADARARELFVVPSPPGGLLVRHDVAAARLGRAIHRLGGELAGPVPERRNSP